MERCTSGTARAASKHVSKVTITGIVGLSLFLTGCGVNATGNQTAPATTSATSDGAQSPSPESPDATQTAVPNDYVAEPPTSVKPVPKVNGGPPLVTQIKTKQKIVFLTIDDGYVTDPKTASVLAKFGVPVTQFLTNGAVNGDRYDYYQAISKRSGQTIQNHTMSHPDLRTIGFDAQKSQICETNNKFAHQFGTRPWMLRPPYGSTNESVRKAANACGIDYIVNWSTTMPTNKLRYQVGNKLRPGDIILTHWSEPYHKWVRGLIKEVRRQGFKFGALQDYLPKK